VVSSLHEDAEGSLWVAAATGLWRWNPGPPTPLFIGTNPELPRLRAKGDHGSGVVVAVDRRPSNRRPKKLVDYPLHGVPSPLTARTCPARSQRWTVDRHKTSHGVVHSYEGKTSLFTHGDGPHEAIGWIALFEDREGTIWGCYLPTVWISFVSLR